MADRSLSDFVCLATGAALTRYQQVRVNSSGVLVACGAGEMPDGVLENDFASGAVATFVHRLAAGTRKVVAAGVIAAGGLCYAAASGKVSATVSGIALYRAIDAAAADGDIIEVIPVSESLSTYSSSFTVTATEAALNSNDGQVDFDTGFGAAPTMVQILVYDTSAGIFQTGFTYDLAAVVGTVRVKGKASGSQLDNGDIIYIFARR